MEHLFYFLVFIRIAIQIFLLIKKTYISDLLKKVESVITDNSDPLRIPKHYVIYLILIFIYFIILPIGVFSSQYIWFLVLLFYQLPTSLIFKKKLSVRYIKDIIDILILIFILVNKYFLHIDIINIIF